MLQVAKNWVSSEKPLDASELSLSGDIVRVSSGMFESFEFKIKYKVGSIKLF